MERTQSATLASSNRFGWVGGSSAYPVTSAPSASSHKESQLPLKPVCPVRKTLRPCQNARLSISDPGRPSHNSLSEAERGYSPRERRSLHRRLPNVKCSIGDSSAPVAGKGHRAFCSRQSVSAKPVTGGASTSANETTLSLAMSRRSRQPSESPIGSAAIARAARALSISPYVQNPPTPSRYSPAFRSRSNRNHFTHRSCDG